MSGSATTSVTNSAVGLPVIRCRSINSVTATDIPVQLEHNLLVGTHFTLSAQWAGYKQHREALVG